MVTTPRAAPNTRLTALAGLSPRNMSLRVIGAMPNDWVKSPSRPSIRGCSTRSCEAKGGP